jgi:transcriptional regulator with XRE-family HTH domain
MAEIARIHSVRERRDAAPEPGVPEPLWREVLGQRLRALRLDQRETLSETAGRAGISPQYLSEIERGRKEPSSEMIAALAGALGTTLIGLTVQVTDDLRSQQIADQPVAGQPVAGQPVAGQPVAGQPVAGQPVAGQPVAGQQVVDLFRASGPVMLSLAA